MSTATLLMIIGAVVCVKTLSFVGFVVWRGRRQRAALDAAAEALASAQSSAPVPDDPSGWRLQWAEPGVLLVVNTRECEAARDVALTATLVSSSGEAASVAEAVRFLGTGACFTARFAGVDPWLTACTFSYAMEWRTPEGVGHQEMRTAHSVVPAPDLTLEAA